MFKKEYGLASSVVVTIIILAGTVASIFTFYGGKTVTNTAMDGAYEAYETLTGEEIEQPSENIPGDSGESAPVLPPVADNTLSGTWQFKENIDFSFFTEKTTVPINFEITVDGSIHVVKEMNIDFAWTKAITYVYDGGSVPTDDVYMNGWVEPEARTITFAHPQVVDEGFYNWFTQNATKL